jgi:predicted transcriptional regulator
MKTRKRPTDAELAILQVLWARGPSTVRDVAQALGREPSYTTVLKLLQIMTDKGLVRRDERERTHVYEASSSQAHTQTQIVRDVVQRVFDGSAATLVLRALEAGRASPEEIAEIRKLLDSSAAAAPPRLGAKHRGGRS